MKKRIFLLLVVCALALYGCGKQQQAAQLPHFSVLREDTRITLDAPAEPVLTALGAPFGYTESKSSRRSGVEKTYHFAGLNLQTYQGRDGDRILGVLFTDSSLKTEEGISLGSTAEEVRACYGADAIQNNCCILGRGQEKLTVLLSNNVVTAIQYSLA